MVLVLKWVLADPGLTVAEQVKLEMPFSLVVTAQHWHRQFIERFDPNCPASV